MPRKKKAEAETHKEEEIAAVETNAAENDLGLNSCNTESTDGGGHLDSSTDLSVSESKLRVKYVNVREGRIAFDTSEFRKGQKVEFMVNGEPKSVKCDGEITIYANGKSFVEFPKIVIE